tara:strand:+ start:144 stop:326 length:183 start_codon:yes stop_codon:yes gene_type:complete
MTNLSNEAKDALIAYQQARIQALRKRNTVLEKLHLKNSTKLHDEKSKADERHLNYIYTKY